MIDFSINDILTAMSILYWLGFVAVVYGVIVFAVHVVWRRRRKKMIVEPPKQFVMTRIKLKDNGDL